MLNGIQPATSPELLKTRSEMGHGDEIILAAAPPITGFKQNPAARGCAFHLVGA